MIDHSLGSAMNATKQKRITDRKRTRLNLAQRVGLLERPPDLLKEEDWKAVRARAMARKAHHQPCPICCDAFGLGKQVILSCSHVFHKVCLKNFERFACKVVCPICRCKDYEIKPIRDGAKVYKQLCIIKIQATWRGYQARLKFEALRARNPPTHPLVKEAYALRKLRRVTANIVRDVDRKEDAIDKLFAQLDKNLQLSRMTMQAASIRGKLIGSDEWHRAKAKWESRHQKECPICMVAIDSKACVLLSCSHVFHHKCLTSFERFTLDENNKAPVCPICRSSYLKRKAIVRPMNANGERIQLE
ncbi:hypothetical protein AAMO2058_001244700 [Amorphochlora amoebiformis]